MDDTKAREVDAIRLAVLRRLAPGLRHRLMGELQSLQFSAELAARLIDSGGERAKIDGAVRQMTPLTRSAIAASAALIEWLRPDDRATTTLVDAVPQCLHVAGDDWTLRGIETSSDVRTGEARVAKTALRELVVTALLVLTDAQSGALDVSVEAERAGSEVVVRLRARPGQRVASLPGLERAGHFDCDDLSRLAAAHEVACSCERDVVALRLREVIEATAPEGREAAERRPT
jgi:hypothetical protein